MHQLIYLNYGRSALQVCNRLSSSLKSMSGSPSHTSNWWLFHCLWIFYHMHAVHFLVCLSWSTSRCSYQSSQKYETETFLYVNNGVFQRLVLTKIDWCSEDGTWSENTWCEPNWKEIYMHSVLLCPCRT